MTTFSSRNVSEADVPAPRSAIWAILTDPDRLAAITPLVRSIEADGDLWCWQLTGISALGVKVAPSFVERMEFTQAERIEFAPAPPPGTEERGGATGTYRLSDVVLADDVAGTHLTIDITIEADLPLPQVSRRAVEKVMATTMERTGARFARNLYDQLGLDPATAGFGAG